MSNYLIDDKNINLFSKEFFESRNNSDKSNLIYAKVDIKSSNTNEIKYLSFLKDLHFLFSYIFEMPKGEYIEIVKQSIPERNPILYTETTLKLFQ